MEGNQESNPSPPKYYLYFTTNWLLGLEFGVVRSYCKNVH